MKQKPYAKQLAFLHAAKDNLKLPPQAKKKHYDVLFELLACTSDPDNATCWPSQETIARRCHCSIRLVRDAISDLRNWGVVSRKQRPNNSNVYSLHWGHLEGAQHVREKLAKHSAPAGTPDELLGGNSEPDIEGTPAHDIEGTTLPPKDINKEIGKTTKGSAEDEEVRLHALHIWKTWNEAIASSTKHKGSPIPSSVSTGAGSPNSSETYRGIADWIKANPADWEQRWELVLNEIPINRYFSGFQKPNGGGFWNPTLRSMFVATSNKEIGVERVLSGEFDSLRQKHHVDTTPVEQMIPAENPKGFECY